MNYRKLNIITDIYFVLILVLGIVYFMFLIFSFVKIFPAFAMQIIFIVDSIKFGHDLIAFVLTRTFIINFVPGLLLFGLCIRLFYSVFILLKNIIQTFDITRNLKVVKINTLFLEFKSNFSSIFTIGFLFPQIYLSSKIFKTHTRQELDAMVQHEVNHQRQRHPLKIFVSNFIKSIIPSIPGKNWLFESYLSLTEISSDSFSENIIKTKLPLVSALSKFQESTFEMLPVSISYFNSQSERIKVLVGQKKQSQNISMFYGTCVIAFILFSSLSIKNSNIFYECRHLISCVETLISPNGPSLITSSEHCQ